MFEIETDAAAPGSTGQSFQFQRVVTKNKVDQPTRAYDRFFFLRAHLKSLNEKGVSVDPASQYSGYFDGSSYAIESFGQVGIVLLDAEGEAVVKLPVHIGKSKTNNVAEYYGLIFLMKVALELGVRHLKAHGDSELVVKQIKGEYAVRNKTLYYLNKGGCTASRLR